MQDFLEAALASLCRCRVVVHGSGRTDAGVHALGQVAHADVPAAIAARFTPERWLGALNFHLPREIRVMEVRLAPPGFEARFSATGKIYRYRLWNARVLPPLEIGRAWHLPLRADPALLRAGAALLEGTHNFAAFAANRQTSSGLSSRCRAGRAEPDASEQGAEGGETLSSTLPVSITPPAVAAEPHAVGTVRTIYRIAVREHPGGLVTLTFDGNGFLYRMVRLLTGTLVRAAQGKEPIEWVGNFLTPPPPGQPWRKSSFAAPAEGLTLVRVRYS